MGLSGDERKRPGWFEELGIRIRTSGGLINYLLFKLGLIRFGLGDPTKVSISREHEPVPTYRCPCCRSLTLHGRGGFEMCPVCWWEDDGQDDHDAQVARGGPNGTISLAEARENYRRFGASEALYADRVRKPRPEETESPPLAP
ncbi:MAG: hypothetical protein K2Z80_24260 [Xanthobacteraceae bacterium]|nr:hypothetical protein [Xanthobacteraceae bacterium]